MRTAEPAVRSSDWLAVRVEKGDVECDAPEGITVQDLDVRILIEDRRRGCSAEDNGSKFRYGVEAGATWKEGHKKKPVNIAVTSGSMVTSVG